MEAVLEIAYVVMRVQYKIQFKYLHAQWILSLRGSITASTLRAFLELALRALTIKFEV